MAVKAYARLARNSQIDMLRGVAHGACRQFGVTVQSMRVLHHAFNTTFGIRATSGDRYALRINVNSSSSRSQIEAEIAWIRSLAKDKIIDVPHPISAKSGEFVVVVPSPAGLSQPQLFCVLYSWISGKPGYRVASEETARLLGEATAKLHRHAKSCSDLNAVTFRPLPDLLFGSELRFRDTEVYSRVYDRAERLWAKLLSSPRRPIHYDLHLANVKLNNGRLFVFDFDDAVSAWPILDASVTSHSLRNFKDGALLEVAYWKGLGKTVSDFGFDQSEFETLVAARAILIANERSKYGSPGDLAFIDKVEHSLLVFEETGAYWPISR